MLSLSQKGVIFQLMTPSINEFEKLYNELFSLSKAVSSINSMEALLTVQQRYFNWLFYIRNFVKSNNLTAIAGALWKDSVLENLKDGGAGLAFGTEKSTRLLNSLQKETKDRLLVLGVIAANYSDKIIQRRDDIFYYLGKPITLGQDSDPYILLEILLLRGDQDGFVSYEDIIGEMRARGRILNQKSISNAHHNLFVYSRINGKRLENKTPGGSRLISVRRGKGLVLNNERSYKK